MLTTSAAGRPFSISSLGYHFEHHRQKCERSTVSLAYLALDGCYTLFCQGIWCRFFVLILVQVLSVSSGGFCRVYSVMSREDVDRLHGIRRWISDRISFSMKFIVLVFKKIKNIYTKLWNIDTADKPNKALKYIIQNLKPKNGQSLI